VFGDQTDVPESADWWNATYCLMWGSNVPVTRTPDAHFMTEARYRGQKVVVISPDYADNTKFADEWLAPHPGTDGALAQAMGHVILTEHYAQRRTPQFAEYAARFTDPPHLVLLDEHDDRSGSGAADVPGEVLTAADPPRRRGRPGRGRAGPGNGRFQHRVPRRGRTPPPQFARYPARFTDLPHLVVLDEHDDGSGSGAAYVPGKFLTAADLPDGVGRPGDDDAGSANARFKTVVLDADGTPRVPHG